MQKIFAKIGTKDKRTNTRCSFPNPNYLFQRLKLSYASTTFFVHEKKTSILEAQNCLVGQDIRATLKEADKSGVSFQEAELMAYLHAGDN